MLHVFCGPDSFSRREALRALKAELDQDGMLETNTVLFEARQTTPQEVVAACDTAPFLGSRRLVIVEGALSQTDSGKGRRPRKRELASVDDENPWRMLIDYVERMPESTTLVLVESGVDAGNSLWAALAAKADVQLFELPAEKAVPQWIQTRARSVGLKMEGGAVRLLANLIGNDTWMLANELEKLSAYAGSRPIREEDVRALVSAAREQKGYLFADAVADGKVTVAVRLLHELRAQGAIDAVLLSTIEGRYRRLAIAREMLDGGASGRSLGERLGSSGYGLERLLEQASRYSMAGLRAVFARLVQADADIKLGVYDEDLSLELLVHDLAAGVVSRAA